MALHYFPCDRDQQMLLPPDVREFVPEGHLARFVVEVVEHIDTSAFHSRHPNDRSGRPAYNPDMLLALCLYTLCLGVRSSRRIEALCEVDLACRYIGANSVPDHSTISRFLRDHEDAFKTVFAETLRLCAQEGMVKVGVVALDGTKVAANASLAANALRSAIEAEVEGIVEAVRAADDDEDARFGEARGDELPPSLTDPKRRKERLSRLRRCLDHLDEEHAAQEAEEQEAARRAAGRRPKSGTPGAVSRAEADVAAARVRAAERARRRAATEARAAAKGRRPGGRSPDPDTRVREAEARLAAERAAYAEGREGAIKNARVNTTDPESRIMKTQRGWVQGYNAQAAVTGDQVIVAAAVTDEGNDVDQFVPMTEEAVANLADAGVEDEIDTVLADAGYFSDANAAAQGPGRLIATGNVRTLAKKMRERGPSRGSPREGASPKEAMEHRLTTEEGAALYKLRGQTVEPVFGQIKEVQRLRRFRRRGLRAVSAEWNFACASHNVLKMFRRRQRAPAPP